MSTNSYTKTRFSANDAALVMIDHQSGIMQLVHVVRFRPPIVSFGRM